MQYPLISEYIEAIRSAEDNFDQYNALRPVLDDKGNPVMSSGNFAVVFKMQDEQTKRLYAVKCFTREQEGRQANYRKIAEELEFVSSALPRALPLLGEGAICRYLTRGCGGIPRVGDGLGGG